MTAITRKMQRGRLFLMPPVMVDLTGRKCLLVCDKAAPVGLPLACRIELHPIAQSQFEIGMLAQSGRHRFVRPVLDTDAHSQPVASKTDRLAYYEGPGPLIGGIWGVVIGHDQLRIGVAFDLPDTHLAEAVQGMRGNQRMRGKPHLMTARFEE